MEKLKKELVQLRRELHRYPEASGQEVGTAKLIRSYLSRYEPDKIITGLGGQGIAAIYNGKIPGSTVLFRCELDALPITEQNDLPYKSNNKGFGHMCGHDGHMSMVAGLASFLKSRPPETGRVVLLFQPAEENGKGADLVIRDEKFSAIKPDYSFALHNLPGYAMREIIIKYPVFAASSRGLSVFMKGKSSHAAEPENGKNPSATVAKIIGRIDKLMRDDKQFKDFTLITPIHIKVGSLAFGTSPGEGEMHFTLRSFTDEDMDKLSGLVLQIIKDACKKDGIHSMLNFHEEFPVTRNTREETDLIEKVAAKNNFKVRHLNEPFKWSEDFGHFTRLTAGALFGLGSGENTAALHNPEFDFPDDLIMTGVQMFKGIYEELLNHN